MATQYIVNEQGEKTGVILPIRDYEELLHQHQHELELTDEYKLMIDQMLKDEDTGTVKYVSFENIKSQFLSK